MKHETPKKVQKKRLKTSQKVTKKVQKKRHSGLHFFFRVFLQPKIPITFSLKSGKKKAFLA